MIFRSEPARSIKFSDRVACPRHGTTMVLVRHQLTPFGARHAGFGCVTFFRCTATCPENQRTSREGYDHNWQCTYMRSNKYQTRPKGERHK